MSNALRAPFDPDFISKLPRITCGDCRKSQGKVCPKHRKSECTVCGNYVTGAHMHLDYVGHAAVTNRLLLVDPGWSWEPVALDAEGLPKISKSPDGQYIMWIKLVVGGVTRLGVGSVNSDAADLHKQLISDAIRNAAIRFGVALDLWSKSDKLESPSVDHCESRVVTPKPASARVQPERTTSPVPTSGVVAEDAVTWMEPDTHDDEDYDDYDTEIAEVYVAEEPHTQVQAQRNAAADTRGGAPAAIAQKRTIGRLMDELQISVDARAGYVSHVLGRKVASASELSRAEAITVVRHLVADKESLDGAAASLEGDFAGI
ncbi:MAG: hypothetical protein HKL82_08745 [Acidimicrobiaceae bacterium]|nr:hypothetical protein [Acidimicrobiaceae bacterium]